MYIYLVSSIPSLHHSTIVLARTKTTQGRVHDAVCASPQKKHNKTGMFGLPCLVFFQSTLKRFDVLHPLLRKKDLLDLHVLLSLENSNDMTYVVSLFVLFFSKKGTSSVTCRHLPLTAK
jgi:hypothetical protein